MEKLFFSVIIPTFERPNDLKRCLISLLKSNQLNSPSYEIIVSDDSDTDKCRIVTENCFEAAWGKGKKIGPAGNRNAGAARAKGEWIVFVDDDCIAQENYLEEYAKAILENPSICVFEGRIFAERARMTWSECCPENEDGGMLWTSNLCVKRSLFTKLGGLDERFTTSYEDVDFAYRLKKGNHISIFVNKAAVCHPWRSLRRKNNKNWKANWHEITSLLLFCEKYNYKNTEYSNAFIYLKNFLRIITKDIFFCITHLKLRGIDILIKDAIISLLVFFLLSIEKINK